MSAVVCPEGRTELDMDHPSCLEATRKLGGFVWQRENC